VLAGCGDGEQAAPAESGKSDRGQKPDSVLTDGDRVLLIGDSLATVVPPTYADLLPGAATKKGVDGVTTANLAEPSTTTADWLPGAELFEERLRPELAGADVVLVSVGGNDLQEALGGSDGIAAGTGVLGSADRAYAAVDESGRNLERTFKAIRKENPDVAIVYVGYPDYSSSDLWQTALGTTGTLALGAGLSALRNAAEDAGPDAVVDMTTATDERAGGVDPLLDDVEYLSPAGHRFYAERIAAALGSPES
jgi:lysophospholipase L1-like esterase